MKALLLTMAFRIGPHWNNFDVAGFSSEKWIRNLWHKRIRLAVNRASDMEEVLWQDLRKLVPAIDQLVHGVPKCTYQTRPSTNHFLIVLRTRKSKQSCQLPLSMSIGAATRRPSRRQAPDRRPLPEKISKKARPATGGRVCTGLLLLESKLFWQRLGT